MTRIIVTGDRHCYCVGLARRVVARMRRRYDDDQVVVHGDTAGVPEAPGRPRGPLGGRLLIG